MGQGIRAGQTVSSIPFGFDRYGRPLRTWRRRKNLSLGEGLLYPVVDGPGIALMVMFPPFLAIMALPVFDLIIRFTPENALNPVNLLIVPFSLPLVVSFTLTIGYVLLFLGRVLASTAYGEVDHPRFPIWDRLEILEELFRWVWAGLVGLAIGGLPALLYWRIRTEIGWVDGPILGALGVVGLAYAQMAWMTALLHDQVAAANPVGVIGSIGRVGWGYLGPCLVTASACLLDLAVWRAVLLHSPNPWLGLLGLWACWVATFYAAVMVVRVLGTLYYQNEARLAWFRIRQG
jgi:hypothetical protein